MGGQEKWGKRWKKVSECRIDHADVHFANTLFSFLIYKGDYTSKHELKKIKGELGEKKLNNVVVYKLIYIHFFVSKKMLELGIR